MAPHQKVFILLFSSFIIGNVISRSAEDQTKLSRSTRDVRKVKYISDGTPAEELIIKDGKIYKEIKELVPIGNNEFIIETRLELQNMELVNGKNAAKVEKGPGKPREKLDIRAHWFVPGGQVDFPKLVYSLNHGWKEVYDEEEFKQLHTTHTAPWGMPGLRWIEVPYSSKEPESRTRVAIPSAFIPIGETNDIKNDVETEGSKVSVKKVHLRNFAAKNDGELVDIPLNNPEMNGKDGEIKKEEISPTIPESEDDLKEKSFENDVSPKATFTFNNQTTTQETIMEKKEERKEKEKKEKKETEKTRLTSILGELIGSRTDTCSPILVNGEESEPLYWIIPSQPCKENPHQVAKIFTTEDGQSFAYYGRPELVSLKKKTNLI